MPKKRSPGDGALYYVPSRKLYKAVVDVGFWPDGRRKQKTVTSRTKAGAREKLDLLKAEIKEHGAPLDRKTTLKTWAEHWLTTVGLETLKPSTLAGYESSARRWIVPALGTRRVAELKPSDVRLMLKRVADAGRGTATARKAHAVLSVMLESARLDGLAQKNVAADVEPPANIVVKQRRSLTPNEAIAVLKTAASSTDGTRWWMSILAGIRQGERLGAQIADLHLGVDPSYVVQWSLDEVRSMHGCGEAVGGLRPCGMKRGAACPNARLMVAQDLEYRRLEGRLCIVRPKSGKSRPVPLIAPMAEALRRHLDATADLPNPHGLIWRHVNGSPFTAGQDEQAWRDVLFAAGVITAEQRKPPKDQAPGTPDYPTSHCARHTTVTVLMELKVPLSIIGEIVGHVDEKTTQGYTHVSSAAARAAMELAGEHFESALALEPLDPLD